MSQASVLRSVIRSVVAVMMLLALSASDFAYANDVTANIRYEQGVGSLHNGKAAKALDKGVFGRPWGASPADFENAMFISDIAPGVSVYTADLDLSPVLGKVKAKTTPLLVFAADDGLVKVRISFDPHDYGRVHLHLIGVLGEPSPIIYEMQAARLDIIDCSEWFVGMNTKVVLTSRLTDAYLEIGRRGALSFAGRNPEDTLEAAQLRQAQEYERQNRIVEASSIYQELLNGAVSSQIYSATAQERLAAYSQRNEAVEFLAKYRGYAFSLLRNVSPGTADQNWLRVDIDNEVRAELQKDRPADIGPQDRLLDIAAALCRVRVVPATGKYAVVEQVWLDSANSIIGTRPAWAPQDNVWPAPYIKQACEDFLEEWFTVGGLSGTGPKKAE